jgi:hypothetical protein
MAKRINLILGVGLLLLGVTSAVSGAQWGPENYPDPKRDTQLCGRKGKQSNICDPDGILSYKAANRVEGIIKDIYDGVDPYVRVPCADQGVAGFQVSSRV